MSEAKEIFKAIPKVMSEVGAVGKDAKNTFDNYKYRSIEAVYNALQPALSKHGVFFVPTILESNEEIGKTAKGGTQFRVKLKIQYNIFASDGSSITCVVEGEGVDRSDKATNKAMTAAFKYMCIQIFCLAIEGMDDADSESPNLTSVDKTKKTTPVAYIVPKEIKAFAGKKIKDLATHKDAVETYIKTIEDIHGEREIDLPDWFKEFKRQFEKQGF